MFTGRVLSGSRKSTLFVVYEPPNAMKLYGLGPEMPRQLHFEGGIARGTINGETLEVIEDRDVRIFRVLDPRVILERLDVESESSGRFRGRYSVDSLELEHPNWFAEPIDNRIRWVDFEVDDELLPTRMTQPDLPGMNKTVTVEFDY